MSEEVELINMLADNGPFGMVPVVERLIRERDETREEAEKANARLAMLSALIDDGGDGKTTFNEPAPTFREAEQRGYERGKADAEIAAREVLLPVKREQSLRLMQHAEQRGYRRGVEDAAKVAAWAHMVPPDGGSPTEDEKAVADEAARRILALLEQTGDTNLSDPPHNEGISEPAHTLQKPQA